MYHCGVCALFATLGVRSCVLIQGSKLVQQRNEIVRQSAQAQFLELKELRNRVKQLSEIDNAIVEASRVNYGRSRCDSKRQAVLDAVELDRMLALEEVDHARRLVQEATEALHKEKMEIESNSRYGLSLLSKRNAMRSELETACSIRDESEKDFRRMAQEAAILRDDIQTCDIHIALSEKENSAVWPEIEEMTGKIASVMHEAIATGRHCSHLNQKQKIRKMLRLELENLRLRKANLELRREARDARRIAIERNDRAWLPVSALK